MTVRECGVKGCDKPFVARGMCNTHYKQFWVGNPFKIRKNNKNKGLPCKYGNCNNPPVARQMCNSHYNKWNRNRKSEEVLTNG